MEPTLETEGFFTHLTKDIQRLIYPLFIAAALITGFAWGCQWIAIDALFMFFLQVFVGLWAWEAFTALPVSSVLRDLRFQLVQNGTQAVLLSLAGWALLNFLWPTLLLPFPLMLAVALLQIGFLLTIDSPSVRFFYSNTKLFLIDPIINIYGWIPLCIVLLNLGSLPISIPVHALIAYFCFTHGHALIPGIRSAFLGLRGHITEFYHDTLFSKSKPHAWHDMDELSKATPWRAWQALPIILILLLPQAAAAYFLFTSAASPILGTLMLVSSVLGLVTSEIRVPIWKEWKEMGDEDTTLSQEQSDQALLAPNARYTAKPVQVQTADADLEQEPLLGATKPHSASAAASASS